MNPLSPSTYCRRHKRRALLLVGIVSLTTLGVCVVARLLDSTIEQFETTERYLTRLSLVSPTGSSLEPGIVSQIRAHPDVAWAFREKGMYLDVPLNFSGGFHLFGVSEADVQVLMDACDLRLKEGRLLRAGTNELLLSEGLAGALGLEIGDQISRPMNVDTYWAIPTSLVLVGILEPDPSRGSGPTVRLGFASYEYVDSHELDTLASPSLVVVAHKGRKPAVDHFLETTIASPHANVWTDRRMSQVLARSLRFFHLIFGVVDGLIAAVIALVVGTIHRIGLDQRMAEFGLLHAVGHSRNRLVRRLTLETATVAGAGWIGGLALSWLLFAWLEANVYAPGMELDLANLTPIGFAAPIPLAVIALVAWRTNSTFARFDAVAIIEQGRLDTETSGRRRVAKRSSANPISCWTFYLRHRRRGLALVVTTALMIVGVAFPAFLLSPMIDANKLLFEHLRHVSLVSPHTGASVDPGVTAQVIAHPAVARVIPAVGLELLIHVPPMNRTTVRIYGVPESDLQVLVDLYGVRLEEGRLPRPGANEIVVSRAIATNRGLCVGDSVGRPVFGQDFDILTEMVVAGILAPASPDPRETDVWSGFASYEYLRSHEVYASRPVSLLVVPATGRKRELDRWLEENVASERTMVWTYEARLREHRATTHSLLLLFAAAESVIAVVAAVALPVLSTIFFAQRREEFGILYAMGHSRAWLVLRTVGETVCIVAIAWLMGAVMCGAGLVHMQANLYAPKGLSLDFLNPVPWLFTLPLPLAVVFVSAGLVARMLSGLDPVSVIERR
jgi:ABC-type lipoprotein release transport system permease subunit